MPTFSELRASDSASFWARSRPSEVNEYLAGRGNEHKFPFFTHTWQAPLPAPARLASPPPRGACTSKSSGFHCHLPGAMFLLLRSVSAGSAQDHFSGLQNVSDKLSSLLTLLCCCLAPGCLSCISSLQILRCVKYHILSKALLLLQ